MYKYLALIMCLALVCGPAQADSGLTPLSGSIEPYTGFHLDEGGEDCDNAIEFTLPAELPYADLNQMTCGKTNDDSLTCLQLDGGEDIIYQLNVTEAIDVDVIFDPKGMNGTAIGIDNSCPPDGSCIATASSDAESIPDMEPGLPYGIQGLHLEPGTYYIMVDSNEGCIPDFDLTIREAAPPPANDICATATEIPDLPFNDSGDLFSANADCDVTGTGLFYFTDVFYKYTVQEAGSLVVDLCSSPNVMMIIWSRDCCDSIIALNVPFDMPGVTDSCAISLCCTYPEIWIQLVAVGVHPSDGRPLAEYELSVSYEGTCGDMGANCVNPYQITLPAGLPFADLHQTTCGMGADYSGTCLTYDYGEDFVYELVVTSPVDIDIILDPMGTDCTAIGLDDSCPLDGTCIDAALSVFSPFMTGVPGMPHGLPGVHLDPGTYYVVVDHILSCVPDFNLTITDAAPPPSNEDCSSPTMIESLPFQDTGRVFGAEGDCSIMDTGENVPDLFYHYGLQHPESLTISLCTLHPNVYLIVWDGCCDSVLTSTLLTDDSCKVSKCFESDEIWIQLIALDMEANLGIATNLVADYVLDVTSHGACKCQPCQEAIVMPNEMSFYEQNTTCWWDAVEQEYVMGCDPYELDCSGTQRTAGPKVFYEFTLECVSTVDIRCIPTINSDLDPQLLVFTECPTPGGNEDCASCVASSDTAGEGETEAIVDEFQPGTYYLSVSAYDGCGLYYLEVLSSDCPLSAELLSFEAIAGDRSVTLRWTTASETDNDHFDVERDGILIGREEATNSPTGGDYAWTDVNLVNGREYEYRLIAVDVRGIRQELGTASATPSMNAATVTEYALHQNFPNPFNPATTIAFDLVDEQQVMLRVFDSLGRTVSVLVNGSVPAGRRSVTFEAADLPSGIYFYHIQAGELTATRKMVLMK